MTIDKTCNKIDMYINYTRAYARRISDAAMGMEERRGQEVKL